MPACPLGAGTSIQMSLVTTRRRAVPTAEELVARARDMVSEIRALAPETERNRNLSPQIVERIRKAELLRTCQPAEFGGFEYDGEVALRRSAVGTALPTARYFWIFGGPRKKSRSWSCRTIATTSSWSRSTTLHGRSR